MRGWLQGFRSKQTRTKALARIEAVVPHAVEEWAIFPGTTIRPQQVAPGGDWTTWLLLGGRGSGKTHAGACWVGSIAAGDRSVAGDAGGRIALVGEDYAAAREVMVEGPSGLLALPGPAGRPVWQPSRRRLEWPNGCVAHLFSSEDPEALRGPQFGAAWCDELGKWRYARETWDMLQFGLRLGTSPRQVVTTTPRAVPVLKEIMEDARTATAHMTTKDNAANLAPAFLDRVVSHFEGTRLGRQELAGEWVEDREDALFRRADIERARSRTVPALARVVVAVDPPVTGHARSDACGMVVAGVDGAGAFFVLADRTLERTSPERWVRAALACLDEFEADRLVVETNQGGDIVEAMIRSVAPRAPVRQVKASRGKWLRAEPVAHLYERGLVHHAGTLSALEDEMCAFGRDGLPGGRSPDRLDALVWALTELNQTGSGAPRARRL